jgi:hypothetical protein
MNYKSLLEALGGGALLVLCGCSELRLPLGNLAPPSPTVNTLPKYYRANPAMPEQPKVYGLIDLSYRLVDWNDVASVQNEYSRRGYVPLGQCDFASQTGAPLQQNALDFARYLGADLVVYAIQKTADGDTRHYIDFLAKTRKPGGLGSKDIRRSSFRTTDASCLAPHLDPGIPSLSARSEAMPLGASSLSVLS